MKAVRLFLSLAALSVMLAPLVRAQQTPPQQNGLVSKTDSQPGAETPARAAEDLPAPEKYLLGPGDVLDLRVFNEPQFSDKLQVTDEGNVEVPFIGAIAARCRSDVQVKKDIVAALSKFLRNPQVSLRLTETKSRPPAVVFGAVRQPTRFEMRRRVHLLDLLAASGGVTEQAGGDIQILHTEPEMCPDADAPTAPTAAQATEGHFTIYKVSELKMGKPEANPAIRAGDIVIVVEAPPIYMTGAVNNPTGIYLREKLTLSRAIAMVGGTKKEARTSQVKIWRQNSDSKTEEVIAVNFDAIKKQKAPDVMLQPYDVVEVPEASGLKVDIKNFLLRQGLPQIGGGMLQAPLRILY